MNKKSHKKKQKKRGKPDAKNKENVHDVEAPEQEEVQSPATTGDKPCYDVKRSDVMGRYVVANRDIRAGEVIIEEPALVVGPCSGCGLICLGCYRELDEGAVVNNYAGKLFKPEYSSAYTLLLGGRIYANVVVPPQSDSAILPLLTRCKGCKWPTCSNTCPGQGKSTGHPTYECELLKTVPPDYNRREDLKDCYQALTPLRCLLLKKEDPEKWKAVSAMEAHNELRLARGDIWPVNEKHVVQRLKSWGLKFEDQEIHTVCGILEVNAFEVGGSGANARALYDKAYLLAHDCTPTTTHTDAERRAGRPITVRASTPHKAGDLISLCYAYTLQGTLKRREHLRLSKFFDCACKRCADPTELGTYCSAFRCPKCGGRVLSTAPLDPHASWQCTATGCSYAMPAVAVQMLLKRLTDEFEQIDANDVTGYEGFLHKYRNVVHDTHYLCLSAQHSLSQLYGKVSDYMIHEMSDQQLTRKIEICRQLMKAFDHIEPGYSRLRGITLYELHAPLMVLTTRDFEKKAISKDNLRERLKEIVSYLTESALILGFEPSQSSEGLMASAAREALKKIKTWEQIIGKIS